VLLDNLVDVDPGLPTAGEDPYRLPPGSPAIDSGLDVSSHGVLTDRDGVSRPQGDGFDIGAYEGTP
jgi:hypothetical protein